MPQSHPADRLDRSSTPFDPPRPNSKAPFDAPSPNSKAPCDALHPNTHPARRTCRPHSKGYCAVVFAAATATHNFPTIS